MGKRVFLYGCIGIFVGFAVFPVIWMLSFSLRPVGEYFAKPPMWIPKRVTLKNYLSVFEYMPFLRYMFNSLVVALGATMGSTLIGVGAGYAIARFRFLGRVQFMALLLVSQMFPAVLLVIPLAMVINYMGFYNSYTGLIVVNVAVSIPFSVWMIKGYVETIPREIEEAALIDGCNVIEMIWRVLVPILRPGISAVAVYGFVLAWGEFVFALTLIGSDSMKTLPIAISMNFGQMFIDYDTVMPMAVMYAVPAILLSAVAQRGIAKGLSAGAVKY